MQPRYPPPRTDGSVFRRISLIFRQITGDAVLLPATPDGHKELATHSVLAGKTWNHPAIVGDRLFVRNAEQAACYRLPTAPQQP